MGGARGVGQGIQAIVCLNGRGHGGGPRDSSNLLLEWAMNDPGMRLFINFVQGTVL